MKGSEEASRFPPGSLVCLKKHPNGQTQVLLLHEELYDPWPTNGDPEIGGGHASYVFIGYNTTLTCIVIAVLESPDIVGLGRKKQGVWALLRVVSVKRFDTLTNVSESFNVDDFVMVPTCPFGHNYTFMTEP